MTIKLVQDENEKMDPNKKYLALEPFYLYNLNGSGVVQVVNTKHSFNLENKTKPSGFQ